MTAHRIPARTVKLGTALVLVTQQRNRVTTWDEIRGWNMLTSADSMNHSPGHARLFIVPGKLAKQRGAPKSASADTYERWHKRGAEFVGELADVPDELGEPVGRALRIDYASDKWAAQYNVTEYTHDFLEDGGRAPLVYTDNTKRPRGFVLAGGSMTISEAGIA